MSRQGILRSARVGRAAIGLLAAAAVVLWAPTAGATPETDATDAITAAWQAGGGDTGPLGPQSGDVYAVGDGFGQNFAGGKIFFTAETGAHAMQGAILEKYESLGGPADSDLGFPTIDEGPGRAPDSRNTTFSAPDKPVIFWTPDTGARVVRGAINAAWDALGGSAGALGVPTDDETYRGNVVSQKFTGGQISYDMGTKSFTTEPADLAEQLAGVQVPDDPAAAISAARRAAGGPLGPLGDADGEPYPIGADGLGQNFAGGAIFYSPATGAHVVTGQVLAKYKSVGGPQGDLGFPTSNEVDGGLAPASRMSTFAAPDKPVIFWTPDYGAVIVRGAMNAAWEKLGGAKGELGAPTADQTQNGSVITQKFNGGVVSWDSATNKFRTEPANLASQLSGLQVPGQDVPKTSSQASDTKGVKGFKWHWWWLVALVPILVLLGLVAFAALRNRRRGRDDDIFGDADYGAPPQPQRESADDDQALFGDPFARAEPEHPQDVTVGAAEPDSALAPADFWGAPPVSTEEPVEELEDDPDAVDTAPTLVPTPAMRNPLTDTGRHAKVDVDEPAAPQTAVHLPLDDPDEAPEGYPIKADTKTGLYWVPGTTLYDEADAEIWFATEEIALTNGFTRAN